MASTYLHLASDLAERIRSAELTDRLPSENELALDRGVSRLTARAALQELESWNLVRRVRGAGTFVAPQLDYTIARGLPPSWHEVVRRAGHRPRTVPVSCAPTPAPAEVRDDLGLDEGDAVLRLVRHGYVDDRPATVAVSWLAAAVVADGSLADLGSGSLFATLRDRCGYEPVRRWARAQLEPPPPEIAEALGYEGRPLTWRLESLNACRRTGVLIERSDTWMRTDTFRVRFHLEEDR